MCWNWKTAAAMLLFMATSSTAVPPAMPTNGTQEFMDRAGMEGLRGVTVGEKLVALYGAAMDQWASDPDDDQSTLAGVDAFFAQNPDVLGVDAVQLALIGEASTHDGKYTIVTYRQEADVDSLPVHGSLVKVVVLTGAVEKIVYIGMHLVHIPAEGLPRVGEISADDAILIVEGATQFGNLDCGVPADATKVVHELDTHDPRRAWRLRCTNDDEESFWFFVDTVSGQIIFSQALSLSADVDGFIKGFATPGTAADSADNPPTLVPIPAVDFQIVPGPGAVCPDGESPDELWQRTDQNGHYGPVDVGVFPGKVASRLSGEWVTVYDARLLIPNATRSVICMDVPGAGQQADLVFNQPTCVGGTNDGGKCDPHSDCPGGLCLAGVCEGGSNQGLSCNIDIDCPGLGTCQWEWLDLQEVNAFVVVEESHKWFAPLLADSTPIDVAVSVFTNIMASDCNSFYSIGSSPPRIKIVHDIPTTCNNLAFSTVLSHEFGHFVLDQHLPGAPNQEFHEGFGDIFAGLMWDTPCMFENIFPEGSLCHRDLESPNIVLGDHDTCGTKPHCLGLALAGAFWDIIPILWDEQTGDGPVDSSSPTSC